MCFVYKSPIKFFFLRRMIFFCLYLWINKWCTHSSTGFTISLKQNRSDLIYFQAEIFPFFQLEFSNLFLLQIKNVRFWFSSLQLSLLLCWGGDGKRPKASTALLFLLSFLWLQGWAAGKQADWLFCLNGPCQKLWSQMVWTVSCEGTFPFTTYSNFMECNCFIVSQIATLYRDTEEWEINHGEI